ncbi:hypothetical protein [Streptomyces sp. NPDC102437]|uniref:hypothetical protein n=1 Tax=Streptomyces sp. NPDC102437 TaxID=3366175 RepID=UPI0037F68A43
MTFSWHSEDRKPYVLVKKTRKPPAKAAFKDPRPQELVAKAKESAPIIRIGAGGQIVSVDLDADSPHILVHHSTGGGKSVTLRGIASRCFTTARSCSSSTPSGSHTLGPAASTASCTAVTSPTSTTSSSNSARSAGAVPDELGIDADPKAIDPRLLILLEEVNATMKQLARYWEKTRESGDPKISPAFDALNEIFYMGSQLRMHVLLVAQSATARALGGPEAREQFSTRIPARYGVNAWRMLAPEVHQVPRARPGRSAAAPRGRHRSSSSPKPKPATGPPPARRQPNPPPNRFRRSCRNSPPTPLPTPGAPAPRTLARHGATRQPGPARRRLEPHPGPGRRRPGGGTARGPPAPPARFRRRSQARARRCHYQRRGHDLHMRLHY